MRWHVRYSLRYRDVEEMMLERGLALDHVTGAGCNVMRPVLNQRLDRERRRPNRSWRVDATYIRVAGNWVYPYRAVDSGGYTIDSCCRPIRIWLLEWSKNSICLNLIMLAG